MRTRVAGVFPWIQIRAERSGPVLGVHSAHLPYRKEVGEVRDLSELSDEDVFFDPDSVSRVSNASLAEKMGQTYLSRISDHRRKARKGGDLRLSQQIGLLLWMNRKDLLSTRGEERLLFLQSRAPWGALEAGMQFALRVDEEEKLQHDLFHWMVLLNCFPSSRRLRSFRARRIGIGYRDKGTLPSVSVGARRNADSAAWVHRDSLPESLGPLLDPASSLTEGEWVDLPELVQFLRTGLAPEDLRLLLDL